LIHHDYVDSLEDAKVRLEYDLYYIKHQSLSLDVQIIVQAVLELLARKGR
jgi:lipopolysaccharide/colanic/teichoic acid biosynthesis glycosyltransferase